MNIWVDVVNMTDALTQVDHFIARGKGPCGILAVNPEKTFSVPQDPLLLKTFAEADLLIPDGIGVVLAARILHGKKVARVPGVELMEQICRRAAERDYKIFIYGAREEVNRAAMHKLRLRYPTLDIVGRAHGYLTEAEMPALIRRINESQADILFLALGSPAQERWFSLYKSQLETVKVCQGIGGSLDVIAGSVKRAPPIWCNLGLEWLYRLLSEPSRIKRQRVLPVFIFKVLQLWVRKLKGGVIP